MRTSLEAVGFRGRVVGQVWGAQGWLAGSCHSPLLAADVMLLDRVAEEGILGARDDSWLPGVHVEGVREPWGREKRGGQKSQAGGGLGPRSVGSPWQVTYLG